MARDIQEELEELRQGSLGSFSSSEPLKAQLQKALYFNRKRRRDQRNKSNLSANVILLEDGNALLLESGGRVVQEDSPIA